MFTPDDLFGDDVLVWYLLHEQQDRADTRDQNQELTLADWLAQQGYDPADLASWNVPEVLIKVPWDSLSNDQGFRPDWL